MRGSFWMLLAAVGVAGPLAVACGSAAGGSTNACSEAAIAHGTSVKCETAGGFGDGAPPYVCGPTGDTTPKSFGVMDQINPSTLCPIGTTLTPSNGSALGSSGGSSTSSSGGSSSGDVSNTSSSSSGGSSSGDVSNTSSCSSGGSSGSTSSSSSGGDDTNTCDTGYLCTPHGNGATCVCTKCDDGYVAHKGVCVQKGNNGVGNGVDPPPPGNPPVNDGPGTSPGNPGNKGGAKKK